MRHIKKNIIHYREYPAINEPWLYLVINKGGVMAALNIYDSTDFQEVDDIEDIKTFYRLLYNLNQATLLMSQATSMSNLYRTAVETATTLLDIDRIGILMVDEQQENISGTWGTDEKGALCNEYKMTSPVDNQIRDTIKLLDNQGKVCIWEDQPLYEFDEHQDTSVVVGFGWNGAIALWENNQLIGWIACDNLLKHRPFKTYISHILRLFGSIISEYRLRFLAQDKIETLNKNLEHKVEELQQTIETLESTKVKLNNAQAHSAMKDLVVGVAHEINTPLGNAIMANSNYPSLLKRMNRACLEGDKESILELLDVTQQTTTLLGESLNTTSSLITEFKRLSTIEIESIPAKKVILKPWLQEITRIVCGYEPELQHLNIKLQVENPKESITLHSEVLLQIMKELLFNAYLHSQKSENRLVIISLKVERKELHLSIEDDGPGIELQLQNKIFNPFITTGRSMGRKGLGLNVAANLVTFLLKGKLSYFDSTLGGAGFLIKCPVNGNAFSNEKSQNKQEANSVT